MKFDCRVWRPSVRRNIQRSKIIDHGGDPTPALRQQMIEQAGFAAAEKAARTVSGICDWSSCALD